MEEEINGWWVVAMWIVLLVLIIAFKILSDIVTEKRCSMMGVRDYRITMDDSKESSRMLVEFIGECLDMDKRRFKECELAGCDGEMTIRNSKDVAVLINCAHKAGGRIVARRVDSKDIECEENSVFEVKKKLTAMDIERAKRIDRKFRR